MCQKLCRNSDIIRRLFIKRYTVHTATQSQRSWEKQQEASDEAIVVKMFAERRMERRASVIQSNYFGTTQKENDDKRNDKVIAN
jgi:hypothetical protein